MKNINKLTEAQLERLAILAEECGEVVYLVGKILRHGYESYNPVTGSPTETNRKQLNRELGDLENIIEMMVYAEDLDRKSIELAHNAKAQTIDAYLHHQ